jgi:hypothetical protein
MHLNFGQSNAEQSGPSPAERWNHDRSLIATWLARESAGHFDSAELRADGSSYIAFPSPFGQISVHDYWSFARLGFQAANRALSHAEILKKQVPVLTLGYTRPDAADRAELVLFLNGEVIIEHGYAEAFGPFTEGKPQGELIAVESTKTPPGMNAVEPYSDPFLAQIVDAILEQTLKPPSI